MYLWNWMIAHISLKGTFLYFCEIRIPHHCSALKILMHLMRWHCPGLVCISWLSEQADMNIPNHAFSQILDIHSSCRSTRRKVRYTKASILQNNFIIITTHQWYCGKVMFSVVSVCSVVSGGRGVPFDRYLWPHCSAPAFGYGTLLDKDPLPFC